MDFENFKKDVQQILSKVELPDGREVVKEGLEIGKDITIGKTLFFEKYGVSSEYEYKQKMKEEGRIMYHAHIGLDTWEETAEGLQEIYDAMEAEGYRLDRFGLCLERGMSLPAKLRDTVARETGPRMESKEDWDALGKVVPIQPHMGDFMIGFPASVENTIHALEAGCTTIGNLSQFFAHEAPGWNDDVATTVATVKAMAVMAAKREEGTLIHSYLDDGLAALFDDYSSIAGWAIMERYIVEDLIGARLGHCFGGVTSTPQIRAAWVFALNDIFDGDCCGSMYYGDTIGCGEDLTDNRTLVAQYLIWDIMAQLKCPTGHAIMPPPFTEGVRIPSIEEIIEVQRFARGMEKAARNLLPYVDFTECYQIKDKIVTGGRRFAKCAMEALAESGVNIEDPVQMLYVLKKLNARKVEHAFCAGPEDPAVPSGRRPVYETDSFRNTCHVTQRLLDDLKERGLKPAAGQPVIVLASADVHEYALFVMKAIFETYGIHVIYLGAEQNPDEIAIAALHHKADHIVVSTHNGGALEFAKILLAEMEERGCEAKVFMGGRLNQGKEGETLPVDVTEDLINMGIGANMDFYDLVEAMSK